LVQTQNIDMDTVSRVNQLLYTNLNVVVNVFIVAVMATGILDYRLTKDTVDSDHFRNCYDFNGRNSNSM